MGEIFPSTSEFFSPCILKIWENFLKNYSPDICFFSSDNQGNASYLHSMFSAGLSQVTKFGIVCLGVEQEKSLFLNSDEKSVSLCDNVGDNSTQREGEFPFENFVFRNIALYNES